MHIAERSPLGGNIFVMFRGKDFLGDSDISHINHPPQGTKKEKGKLPTLCARSAMEDTIARCCSRKHDFEEVVRDTRNATV